VKVVATYESGTIKFAQPLKFVRQNFQVTIDIPEAELAPATQPPSSLDVLLAQTPDDPWLQRMKAIEAQTLALPDNQLPELTPKQLSRIEAFAMREDR
jgi:hypothetical protein